MTFILVQGYRLELDRYYEPDTHIWVQPAEDSRVRIGLDPLGVETAGTLAQLALGEPGTSVARGEPLGTMEAEKFVGPLVAPVSGRIVRINAEAVADPRIVNRDPLGAWLVELDAGHLRDDLPQLVCGDDVASWFGARLAEYRERGVLAE